MAHQAPYVMARCEDCQTLTTHGDFTDEHGANRLTACVVCRRVMERP